MDSIPSDGKDLLQSLKRHPAYEHLNDPDFFVDYPIMHSPLALPGMARAVQYLDTALSQNQEILLVGDRDVDGVSSTALLQRFLLLRKMRSQPEHPNGQGTPNLPQTGPGETGPSNDNGVELVRTLVSDEGDDYGLAGHFLTRILESTASLIVLMDMGSAHLPEIQSILDTGKKVIVLDHHVISDPTAIPDCGFINPRLLPYLENLEHEGKIATVGLVFKLLAAYALFHTGLWNRIEVLLQTDGHYHLYRNGAFLYSSGVSSEQPSIIPSELQDFFPATLTDPSSAARSIQEALMQAAANVGEDRMMENGLFSIENPEIQVIQESDLVGEERKRSAPWLESMEGRLRAGQYLFSAAVMQRPRLLEFLVEHSDLAAIGLVTDMVPLRGENRTVARLGMRLNSLLGTVIPEPQFRPGLSSLYSALRIDRTNWSGRDFGWKIGPVLNAAGRMGETHLALALLCSVEQEEADTLARKLVRLNERRKDRTRKNQEIVDRLLVENPEKASAPILVCYDESLEPGVSGILATRLMERYQKPVVYMNPDGERIRGSVRSFGGLSALKILEGVSGHLLQYGGHPEAAGFSLEPSSRSALESALLARMNQILEETGWDSSHHEVREGVVVDLPIRALNRNLYEQMELLEPFGPGNPEPVFRVHEPVISEIKFLSGGLHAQIQLDGNRSIRAVLWNRGALLHSILESMGVDASQKTVSVRLPLQWMTGTLEADVFRGGKKRSRFQFVIQDFQELAMANPAHGAQEQSTTSEINPTPSPGAELFASANPKG